MSSNSPVTIRLDVLAPDELDERASAAARTLRAAGADHVLDTIADLPALLERLENGGSERASREDR